MSKIIAAVVALVLAFGAGVYVSKTTDNLGASSGPEHFQTEYFYGDFAAGAGCYATTTTGVLTSKVLNAYSCITIGATGAGQAAVTLTTQATTTMGSLLPRAGMCRSWWIDASNVAAATTTTFAAGTGVNVVGLDATGAGTGADVIDGVEYGRLTLCREADKDVAAFIEEWIHAD